MLGFRIVIDRHGDVQRIDMPTQASEDEE